MSLYIPCGACTDPSTRILYIAVRETVANSCGILAYAPYSVLTQKAAWLITDFTLTSGAKLDFASHVSMWVIGKDLNLTDGKNPPRKINLAKGYGMGTLTEGDISAVPYAPLLPVSITSGNDPALGITPLQKMGVQFVLSYIYDNKTYSVLGPYSPTLPPVYISASASGTDLTEGNVVTLALDGAERIPETATEVELYYREMDAPNTHGLLKRWRKSDAAEAAQMAAHNAGTTPLAFTWEGVAVGETLDKERYAVPFSNMPLLAGTGFAAGNASLYGNTTTGYPAAPAQTGITIGFTQNTLPVDETPMDAEEGYYIVQRPGGNDKGADGGEITTIYYAYVIRRDGKWYWVKEEGYYGSYYNFNILQGITNNIKTGFRKSDDKTAVFYPPAYVIPASRLVLLESIDPSIATPTGREGSLLSEIHGYPFTPEAATGNPGETYLRSARFQIQDDLSSPPLLQSRLFPPKSQQRWGLQYLDAARRGCGSVEQGAFAGLGFKCSGDGAMDVLESAQIYLPAGIQNALIPAWAKTVTVVRSENTVFNEAVYGRVQSARWAYHNPDGGFSIDRDTETTWQLAGIAIPVSDLAVIREGYAYKEGDRCTLMISRKRESGYGGEVGDTYEGEVLGMMGGYAIVGRMRYIPATNAVPPGYDPNHLCCEALALPGYKTLVPYTGNPGGTGANMDNGMPANRAALLAIGYYCIYTSRTDKPELQHTGAVCAIVRDNSGNRSFASPVLSLRGNLFWRLRKSSGIDVCLPDTQPMSGVTKNSDDLSRTAPEDLIGQLRLPTNMVWTEDAQPTALRNASGMVLPLSYKTLDTRYGGITAFVATGGIEKEGAVALALCESGAYALSIRRTVLTEGDGTSEVIALSKDFIGAVQEAGRYGCRSPKTLAAADGVALWYDATYQQVVLWEGSRPVAINEEGIAASVKYAATDLTPTQIALLTGGIHPRTGEYFLCMPIRPASLKTWLPTADIDNPFEPFPSIKALAFVYNYKDKKWVGIFHGREHTSVVQSADSPIELYATVGDQLFVFWQNALYKEFTAQNDSYYGRPAATQRCGMALVFNEGYPVEKTPMVVTADSTHMPQRAWLTANDTAGVLQVATTDSWKGRGGSYQAPVLRERTREGSVTTVQSGDAAEMSGPVLRGKSVRLWLSWRGEGGVAVRSVSIRWKALGGKLPPKG